MAPQTKRHFCFTINNYTELDYNKLTKKGLKQIKYIVVGKEVGLKEKTPHLQCFVSFHHEKSINAAKKYMEIPYIEFIYEDSTPYKAAQYCKKDGDYYEEGTPPKQQGKRKDIDDIKNLVSQGSTVKEMLKKDQIKNYQGLRFAEGLKKYYETKRNWKPTVIWYYGKPGTGKTHKAMDICHQHTDEDNIYEQLNTGQWWEGYDGQEYVVIDDMRGDFMKFNEFIKLIDRYPYRVQTKGSTRQFLAKVIIITSPFPPERVYHTSECINQLLDRIDLIKEITGENKRTAIKEKQKEEINKIFG